ncbi:CPBP family intramembrane glutamic endopeptidase [Winogradskyella sp. UBA3174]|uniref:CPBP family intramembrane glutamic endopeptidase n=1 Tax=Winogradskyella sp. UBA3174 TaxID=1947785 RepID=UPI0025D42703|nr:CPBP family intramembrane glutamic endopeptidase [Winogradskyella sp. UBA3174]|tara:strand:+ start:6364 stop:7119 length:756 start_codon:yes stop_codon:yes gene_type:complete
MIGDINLKRILVFLIIAITISNIFRFDIFELKSELERLPTWIFILTSVLLEGSGVIIGALIAISLLKKKKKTEITLFGTSKSKSLIMLTIPIVILTIIGVKNDFELDAHLYGFIAVIGTLIYCIMEEYGWRGYLQEELKAIKSWQKYLIIGFLWYLWHLTFLTKATVGDNLFFFGMMVFGSWGIGQVAESTKSIIACACFHLVIQIMMFNALIKNGINGTEKLIIFGISVVLWFLIIKKWEKQNTITKQST